ncbi:MAG: hypothetical protein RSD57_10510 [Comamonas sp.]
MLGVAPFFNCAVLIVNGVGLSGHIKERDSAPFNSLLAFFINATGILRHP